MRLFLLFFLLVSSTVVFAQNPHRLISVGTPIPNEPLMVVNGMPLADSKAFMALMNPNDIEKIEILKDASSTAIYGYRGANGVILVTLKKNVKLIPLAKLFKRFKVNKNYRKYSVFVENEKISYPNEFLASAKWIKEIIALNSSNGQIDIPYLNIVTNK